MLSEPHRYTRRVGSLLSETIWKPPDPPRFDLRPFAPLRSRGELPHLEVTGGTYFVTFCLRAAVSPSACQPSPTEPSGEPESIARRSEPSPAKRPTLLRHASAAAAVEKTLLHFHADRYLLHAWCVMPDHVHVVVSPLADRPLRDITHGWKSFSARRVNAILERAGHVWERESFDHLVRSEDSFGGSSPTSSSTPCQPDTVRRLRLGRSRARGSGGRPLPQGALGGVVLLWCGRPACIGRGAAAWQSSANLGLRPGVQPRRPHHKAESPPHVQPRRPHHTEPIVPAEPARLCDAAMLWCGRPACTGRGAAAWQSSANLGLRPSVQPGRPHHKVESGLHVQPGRPHHTEHWTPRGYPSGSWAFCPSGPESSKVTFTRADTAIWPGATDPRVPPDPTDWVTFWLAEPPQPRPHQLP